LAAVGAIKFDFVSLLLFRLHRSTSYMQPIATDRGLSVSLSQPWTLQKWLNQL